MKIQVLEVRPGKAPVTVFIDNSLEALQEAVGGNVEVVYPFEDSACLICNENGKIDGLPLNRALYSGGIMYDIVAGTFYVAGTDVDSFCSLTEDQIRKYTYMYRFPEVFFANNGRVYSEGAE